LKQKNKTGWSRKVNMIWMENQENNCICLLLSCVKFANCVQIYIRRDSRSIRWQEFPSWTIFPRRFACPRKVREEDWTNRWKQYRVLIGLFDWIFLNFLFYMVWYSQDSKAFTQWHLQTPQKSIMTIVLPWGIPRLKSEESWTHRLVYLWKW
jgi:hypothetical protein